MVVLSVGRRLSKDALNVNCKEKLMSCRWMMLALLAILAPSYYLGSAQAAGKVTQETAPVPLVAAPKGDPVVGADGSAVFSLDLPNAKDVKLTLEGGAAPMPMVKDDAGRWTVTVPHLDPEYYSYNFVVDGVSFTDPHNTMVKTSAFSVQSVFLVPGGKPWEIADVPHGEVHHHLYHSAIVQADSEYYVYTPPGFDAGSKKTYPVLYLLHGYSDDASAWTSMARANLILDNLMAAGKAKPMIVVMPLGYGNMEMITRGWAAWRDPGLPRDNFQKFGEALFREVMPRVQKEYPLSSKREEHAIAGLSMGGAESLLVGLGHTEEFAYVGGFSAGGIGSGPFDAEFPAITPATGAAVNGKLKLLWISCGTDDGLYGPNQKLVAWLKERNVTPKVTYTPGRHVWMVWRDNLSNFVPLLFQ
ncbi:Endo-1,4-beta-xylanase A precursor [Granulicella sibirica]|uniref:Endo-1,4-beta-xylanase A n=2 Tax=Granulicella sibirica TaxID=2479048 RepID=A0A4Q0SWY0_9BACT|nr:Endo-1,4-beta-xylanase A precursor [Granulicella sibirica]